LAFDGQIHLSFDPDLSQFHVCEPLWCRETKTLYVIAQLRGASQNGITGAEYKIQTGVNDALDSPVLFYSETFHPAATVVGSGALTPPDPDSRGVNVVWPTCQVGDSNGQILIQTIQIFNPSCEEFPEMGLQVVRHSTPSNSLFQCPLFVLCDGPVYTKVCIGNNLTTCRNPDPPFPLNATCSTGERAYLGSHQLPNFCVFPAVEPSSWSGVKALYRDATR
jgi:hypothetical protein